MAGVGPPGGAAFAERESLFEDSDRFEEESLDSSTSEQDLSLINWRGWKVNPTRLESGHLAAGGICSPYNSSSFNSNGEAISRTPDTLLELCARKVAEYFPFEAIEKYNDPIPVDVQLRISFWSFPTSASDIRLYSCLGNGNSEEYSRGEAIVALNSNTVVNMLQIGFHLSGQVNVPAALSQTQNSHSNRGETFAVSVTFDRKRITQTNCTCQADIQWCRHVVALCLHRIRYPTKTEIRAPVSESLSRLQRDQLQKFAQYLISELPTQVLPTAQRLLDQLCGYTPLNVAKVPSTCDQSSQDTNMLSPSAMPINLIQGAPDPTAGPSLDDVSMWTLDEDKLQSKLRRTLMKFVLVMPASVTDFASIYPQSAAPPASSEFNTLLRPIKGHEPEAVWNLLAIVKELCRKHDSNSLLLLDIITQQCISIDTLVIWWFTSRTAAHYYPNATSRSATANRNRPGAASSTVAGQQCCASLLDEIVNLWTLLILNPRLGDSEKQSMIHTMKLYHVFCIHKIQSNQGSCLQFKRNELRNFQGFKTVIKAALSQYPIEKFTDRFLQAGKPRQIPGSQQLYSYAGVNNIVEPAQILLTKMIEECKRGTNQESSAQSGTNNLGNQGDAMFDDDDDDYEDDFNNSYEENVFVHNPSTGAAGGPSQVHTNHAAYSHNLVSQISDSLDEGLDNSSRRASITSASFPNQGGSEFPIISHFNVVMHDAEAVGGLSGATSGGNLSSSGAHSDANQPLNCDSAVPAAATTAPVTMDNEVMSPMAPLLRLEARSAVAPTNPNMVHNEVTGNNCSQPSVSSSKLKATSTTAKGRVFDIFSDLVPIRCQLELLFLLMDSFHTHNFLDECYKVAGEVAQNLLNHPPDLLADPPPHTRFRRKIRYELSVKACQIQLKVISVINILFEKPELRSLAFKLGIFGLELARLPSPSKMFEVKMYHLETLILGQMRSLICGKLEMDMLREKARVLASFCHFRGKYLVPLHLAMLIFENLCNEHSQHISPPAVAQNAPENENNSIAASSAPGTSAAVGASSSNTLATNNNMRTSNSAGSFSSELVDDMDLGFKAALACLAMKPQIAEADNPLLCESIRRSRAELTLNLLLKFKDNRKKLRLIIDALLGHSSVEMYTGTSVALGTGDHVIKPVIGHPLDQNVGGARLSESHVVSMPSHCMTEEDAFDYGIDSSGSRSDSPFRPEDSMGSPAFKGKFDRLRSMSSGSDSTCAHTRNVVSRKHQRHGTSNKQNGSNLSASELYDKRRVVYYATSNNACSSSFRQGAKLRKHTHGQTASPQLDVRALALSSAENAAACNIALVPSNTNSGSKMSFPLSRRWYRGKKCYSNVPVVPNQPSEALAHSLMELAKVVLRKASGNNSSSGSGWHMESFNMSNNAMPFINLVEPVNQPRIPANPPENAHFIGSFSVELDRSQPPLFWDPEPSSFLNAAAAASFDDVMPRPFYGMDNGVHLRTGLSANRRQSQSGMLNSTMQSINNDQPMMNSTTMNGAHRWLHLAAFEIGLHALCVLNCVSSNWLSRTYSTYESWIQTQTLEIGSAALNILTERWVGTLTPSEAAGISQKAGKNYDASVRSAGMELALSVLEHASALGVNEIIGCLEQCEEEGMEVLERACQSIESAHEQASPVAGSGVPPQILFKVAKYYKLLHDLSTNNDTGQTRSAGTRNQTRTSGGNQRVFGSSRIAAGVGGYEVPDADQANSNHVRVMNPSEESQVQASYDIVQQDLHNYLFQQFLFPSTFLLRPPDQNQAPPPQPLSAIFPLPPTEQQQLEEFRRFIRPGASNAPPSNRHNQPAMTASPLNLIGGTPLQSHVRPPPHLMNPNPLPAASIPPMQLVAPSDAANNVVSPPANLVVTQSRYSKRAFLNGLEAVKTIIRRSTENKEEFIPNKVVEYEGDLKWLITLTIQMAKPENHKMLSECMCSGGLRNPFLLHNLTDFSLRQLQEFISASSNLNSGINVDTLARQHYLFVNMSNCTWQKYVECLNHKLEMLGSASGLGDDDLLKTVTKMRTAAFTQFCTVGANPCLAVPTATNPPGIPSNVASGISGNGVTFQRISEMARLITGSRNLRPDMQEKIRQLFLA